MASALPFQQRGRWVGVRYRASIIEKEKQWGSSDLTEILVLRGATENATLTIELFWRAAIPIRVSPNYLLQSTAQT